MQKFIVGILFIGLMLIAAGIGAWAAEEVRFGMIFGYSGAAVVVLAVILLLVFRKRHTG